MTTIKDIQTLLGVVPDGIWGPTSQRAFDNIVRPQVTLHAVLASTFADPADVRAYREAKARGLSDDEAFKVGDNGVGKWGDSTVEGSGPSCALPPEDWEMLPHPRNTRVRVVYNGKSAVAFLRDTMPHRAHITNGCGLDMNPDLCAALGVRPGNTYHVIWSFV